MRTTDAAEALMQTVVQAAASEHLQLVDDLPQAVYATDPQGGHHLLQQGLHRLRRSDARRGQGPLVIPDHVEGPSVGSCSFAPSTLNRPDCFF
jgi:hypothetical protein